MEEEKENKALDTTRNNSSPLTVSTSRRRRRQATRPGPPGAALRCYRFRERGVGVGGGEEGFITTN